MQFIMEFELYLRYGGQGYIGEAVTQYQHAVQCSLLAEEFTKTQEFLNLVSSNPINPIHFIVGCFFHDIGHLLKYESDLSNKYQCAEMGEDEETSLGVMYHEKKGGQYLRDLGYHEDICSIVENHINIKRYLITKNPDYYDKLSEASKGTFEFKGGKMTIEELNTFENNRMFPYHLMMRTFDDQAKSTDADLLDKIEQGNYLKYYQDLIKNNKNNSKY